MTCKTLCSTLALALALAACGQAATPPPLENETVVADGEAPAPAAQAASNNSPAVSEDGAPDLTPPVLTDEAERTEKGARNVLLSFARAIELKQFDQAWALLSPADKAKWSRARFAAMFADLGKITVAIPTGEMEGAAGSSFYSAPVTITADDKDGRPVRIEGKAVLRRTNDVPGSTEAQRRWHFETLTLDWTH